MKNKNAADKDAAGTGGARVARYRRAVMEPKAEPRKRHPKGINGSIEIQGFKSKCRKKREYKLTFVHFGKFLAI